MSIKLIELTKSCIKNTKSDVQIMGVYKYKGLTVKLNEKKKKIVLRLIFMVPTMALFLTRFTIQREERKTMSIWKLLDMFVPHLTSFRQKLQLVCNLGATLYFSLDKTTLTTSKFYFVRPNVME